MTDHEINPSHKLSKIIEITITHKLVVDMKLAQNIS
jgi:hypothetical protein